MPRDNFSHLDTYEEVASAAFGRKPLGSDPYPSSKILAEVLHYNLDSDSYELEATGLGGRPDVSNEEHMHSVPRKVRTPGEAAPLETGTIVIVDRSLGFPFIDGILPINTTREEVESDLATPEIGDIGSSVTDIYNSDSDDDYWRRAGIPKDIIPGDFCQISPEGNYVAVLRSKLNMMVGSPRAQILTVGSHDLVRIVSEDYEHYHALGYTKIFNEEGRSSLQFRAGADQQFQSGGNEENWSIELDVGAKGDLIDLRVLSNEGKIVSTLNFSADGKVTIVGLNGVDIVNAGGAASIREVGNDEIVKITGNQRKYIDGNQVNTILGAKTSRISESKKEVIGTNLSQSINNHKMSSIGGSYERTITGGDALTADPTNVAASFKVLNGSYNLEIGDIAFASKKATPGFNIVMYNGNAIIGESPYPQNPSIHATTTLYGSKPDSIGLGGFPTLAKVVNPLLQDICPFHAMKFEPYSATMKALMGWLDGFQTWADTHVHQVISPGSPTDPPKAPSNLVLGTSTSAVGSTVDPAMSTRVMIGL